MLHITVDMKRILILLSLLAISCARVEDTAVLPITGTWVNLVWQDGRNDYTNPRDFDYTQAALWHAKVREWKGMGMEYLVLLQVANDGKAFYPSQLMPPAFTGEESPVSAIMDEAARCGIKVFLSTGWAKDQFEDLRDPWVQKRQQQIMEELTGVYWNHPAFFGWYLPVEDCIIPVFPKTAVAAVNTLVERAHTLTPGKKTMISPYGMFGADFSRSDFAENIRSLKVDIIAYQDEVGCVRETFPLRRVKENWKKLRAVHEGSGIEMWANCETFTWTRETNSHFSALIPAAYSRLLAQQAAATDGGVSKIISFAFAGIIEDPASTFQIGQPVESVRAFHDYMAWKNGDAYWKTLERSLRGVLRGGVSASCPDDPRLTDSIVGEQEPDSLTWVKYPAGKHSIHLQIPEGQKVQNVFVRFLDYAKGGILPPERVCVYTPSGDLVAVKLISAPGANRHDAWVDGVLITFEPILADGLVLTFSNESEALIDEVYLNV